MLASDEEIFILSLTLGDGSPFVTSVSSRRDIRAAAARRQAVATEVSHWGRDIRAVSRSLYAHPLFGWRLLERYDL